MNILKNNNSGRENPKLMYENMGRRIANWQRKTLNGRKLKVQNWQALRTKIITVGFYLATGTYVFCLAFKAVVQPNAPPVNNYLSRQYG